MYVVASGAIGTESFDSEVYARFGLVVLAYMDFFPDLLVRMSKGALTKGYFTL